MEDFLIRDEGSRPNSWLLLALLSSVGVHVLFILPRWHSPVPRQVTAVQATFEVRLPPAIHAREAERMATDVPQAEKPAEAQETVSESEKNPDPVENHVELPSPPESQAVGARTSIQRIFDDLREVEQDYRLPRSSDSESSAFDPHLDERLQASERFKRSDSSSRESVTSYSESSGAERVEVGSGSCFRVDDTADMGGERAWVHVRCKRTERLRLNPESHLDQVNR